MSKEIYVTVYSGMCNRMFAIASALRISNKFGHKVSIFWPERTGRYGLPYYGEINSDWDDYFERIDGVSTYGITGSIKFQNKKIAIDQEQTLPENLPYKDGKRFMKKELVSFIFGPKEVDPNDDLIIVQKTTKPFGIKSDNMANHTNYINKLGVHKKDDYLSELSDCVKSFVPKQNIMKDITTVIEEFSKFNKVWGIHIRGTDLAPQSGKDRKAAIMQIIRTAPKNVGFFVASDEPIDWVIKIAGKNRIIHYNNPLKLENSIEGSQYALVDLFVLSKCHKILGSCGSSFSMMSWLLSDLDEYHIHS